MINEVKRMPRQKIDVIEDVKKNYVRIALETGKITSTAKKAGICSDTLRKWIKEYEEEVRDEMEVEGVTILSENPSKEELLKKYEQAMKLLGEKELEVAILKEVIKKNGSLQRNF
jgi:transposase-like protein